MSDIPDTSSHPTVSVAVREWVNWFGVGRLVASAVAVVAVAAGGYWLVRPPSATTESKLPYASRTTATATVASPSPTPSTLAVATVVVVHVSGAVATPGVYELPAGARVADAVSAAGGALDGAAVDALNLAAHVVDGTRVYVPADGETVPGTVPVVQAGTPPPVGPLNLNTATAAELDALPGVGPSTASAIVAYRDQHGPFATVDDLTNVRGIGPAKLDAVRALVTV